jgi:hypothetical protein
VGVFERVEYHDDQRAGFLGLAGFLSVTSLDNRTSPSRRGRWIAGNLLCREPKAPPPNVPMLEDSSGNADGGAAAFDVRASLERHRKVPACASCHALFDPYGLALEHYDALGRFRSAYADGTPIDAAVMLPGSPSQAQALTVDGLAGLSEALSTDPSFGACLAQKLLTYGLGRTMTPSDDGHLQLAVGQWRQPDAPPSIGRLIHALVASRAFLFRRAQEGSTAP